MSRHARFCALSSLLVIIGVLPYTAFAGTIPNFTPGYALDWSPVAEGGVYDFSLGGAGNHAAQYTWPGGRAIGILYKGTFQGGATPVSSHFLGSSGSTLEFSDYFASHDDYFVVVYHLPFFADPDWHASVDAWLRHGPSSPGAFPPDSWGIVRFRVGVPLVAPNITSSNQYREFGVDEIDEGGRFVGNAAVFKAQVNDPDSLEVSLELELKPHDVAFDGVITAASGTSSPGEIEVAIDELIPVSEHYVTGGNEEDFKWRVRARDGEGNVSDWEEFGADSLAVDFSAKVVPLWTQGASPFLATSIDWAGLPYSTGYDEDCSKDSPSQATIAKCGCAITSLVMIARYYGIEVSVDGTEITPDGINAWLRANSGYVGDNLVSWPKVEEYLGLNIDGIPHKLLAFDRENYKTTSRAVVDGYLEEGVPVIAYKNSVGHYFVMDSKVAKSDTETYTVRDPQWYFTRTLSDTQDLPNKVKGYGNSFTHGTIFTKLPTPTKLAAHSEFYLASPAEILITDPAGRRTGKDPRTGEEFREIPGAVYAREDRIVSSEFDDAESGHQVKSLLLPQLIDGAYQIQIIGTGEGPFTFTASMSDELGETQVRTYADTTLEGDVSALVFGVVEGEPVDTYPTRGELLTRLENEAILIGDKALSALLMQLHKQLELENMTAVRSLGEAIAARIEQLGDKGKISAELKATMLGWVHEIYNTS